MSQSTVILKPKKKTLVIHISGSDADQIEKEFSDSEELVTVDSSAIAKGMKKILGENKDIRPFFSSAWVTPTPPADSELLEEYKLGDTTVKLYRLPSETESMYQIIPFEYTLPIEQIELIYHARTELSEHYPKNIQLTNREQARTYVIRLAEELVLELARKKGIRLGKDRTHEILICKTLSKIIAKYTAGFGVSETFLEDEHIQDVYIDAPASQNPIYLNIGGFKNTNLINKCRTNVRLSREDYESLLSRFRFESGRPFSEAMPVLEHNLSAYDARVTVIGKPLSPDGLAVAIRRHSLEPWTLLRFIANGMLSPLAAGLISFLIDGKSTILVAGSRGSGKTSLLGAMVLEMPQSQRILTIEDTHELPTSAMQKLGYKVQSLMVQSSLGGKGEMSAEEALRVSLRLGESAIILGEVRGKEAKTLYEAMRAGTAGSSVMGTFHADSARSVFERVTHDIGIPPKSFLATDVIIVAGVTRPGGTQKEVRRVKQITEVLKNTGIDGEFEDIMAYNEITDGIEAKKFMMENSERIKTIAKSWNISFMDALKNIELRAAYRRIIVDYANEHDKQVLLSPRWVMLSNNTFWNLMEKYHDAENIDYAAILKEWREWFERNVIYE